MLSDLLKQWIEPEHAARTTQREVAVRKRSSSGPPVHKSRLSDIESLKTPSGKAGTVILRTDFKTVVVQNTIIEMVQSRKPPQPIPVFREPYSQPKSKSKSKPKKKVLQKAATSLPFTITRLPCSQPTNAPSAKQQSNVQSNFLYHPMNTVPSQMPVYQPISLTSMPNYLPVSQPMVQHNVFNFMHPNQPVMNCAGLSTAGLSNPYHPTAHHGVLQPQLSLQESFQHHGHHFGAQTNFSFNASGGGLFPRQIPNNAMFSRKRSLSQPLVYHAALSNHTDSSSSASAEKRMKTLTITEEQQTANFVNNLDVPTETVKNRSPKSYLQL